MTKIGDKRYRYHAVYYAAGLGDDDCSLGFTVRVELIEYVVVKITPCGVWVVMDGNVYKPKRRFIKERTWMGTRPMKRYAYHDKREAMISFLYRCERHVFLCKMRLDKAERALIEAKQMAKPPVEGREEE
jgi:hypothetical protein